MEFQVPNFKGLILLISVSTLIVCARTAQRCSDVLSNFDFPCTCSLNSLNGTDINCDKVVFYRDIPLFPYRYRIHSFSVRDSGIQDLSSQLFTASDIPLKRVDFSHNLIRRLTDRMFNGVEDTLEELDFSHNLLGDQLNPTFSTTELKDLRNLRILDFSSNSLEVLDNDLFDGLRNLRIFRVTTNESKNSLDWTVAVICDPLKREQQDALFHVIIGYFAGEQSSDVTELNLKDNFLQNVPTVALQRLERLKTLSLQGNKIKYLREGSFGLLNSLVSLDISRNSISQIQVGTFTGLTRVNSLNLAKNKIKSFSQNAFTGLKKLGEIHLSENFITEIPFEALNNLTKLHRLDLSSNKIRQIQKGSLSSFVNLKYLDLSRNQIGILSGNPFSGLTKLRSLNLNVNGIRNLDVNLFGDLEELEALSLDDNQLFAMPTGALRNLKNLKTISLNHNRIAGHFVSNPKKRPTH
ncbi:Leucine-rich repeats and immunoglobulin-like domains protein sma-10 [Nymphon striatum]|nr:Leucine-rich repeats and immunoglobulin-like domains protein sma-10 [Nymphon striatum]